MAEYYLEMWFTYFCLLSAFSLTCHVLFSLSLESRVRVYFQKCRLKIVRASSCVCHFLKYYHVHCTHTVRKTKTVPKLIYVVPILEKMNASSSKWNFFVSIYIYTSNMSTLSFVEINWKQKTSSREKKGMEHLRENFASCSRRRSLDSIQLEHFSILFRMSTRLFSVCALISNFATFKFWVTFVDVHF